MKDTVIKGNGKSRVIKAPADMPETFAEWRSQAMAGQAYLDVGLNTDTSSPNAGCTVIGTPQNKATMLDDSTKAALELKQSDPTLNDALYALSQKGSPAEVRVMADKGSTVKMEKDGKVLTGVVSSSTGYATLYPTKLGEWTITYQFSGSQKVRTYNLEVIGIVTVYPFTAGSDLEHTEWGDISVISQLGMAEQFFKVGDTKNIKVNGVSYPVQIIGFKHDNLSAGGKAGITFQMVDCLSQTYQMETSNTNANGWDRCRMRTSTMATLFNQLEAALRSTIKPVNKLASAGNQSSTIKSSSDKLFLLSEVEIFGNTTYSKPGEGTQYAWYKAGNSRIKKVNGSAYYWWERSPRATGSTGFCLVGNGGSADGSNASDSLGVSFGFCV